MKKFFQKKQLMMVALVVALGVAVYLNYYLTKEPTLSAGGQAKPPVSSQEPEEDDRLGEATFVDAPVSGEGDKNTDKQPDKGTAAYFDTARKNRTTAREEALGIIRDVLDNAQASAEDKTKATAQATAIADNVLQESHIESLIVAKGFADCVVFIDGENCSVVVQGKDLQQQETLQIMEIVVSQSDVAAKNVQIMAAA